MELNGRPIPKITIEEFHKLLSSKRNLMVFGPSGYGKTAIVEKYAEENGRIIVYLDLAGRLPEEVAGIPYVVKDTYDCTEEIKALEQKLKDLSIKMNDLAKEGAHDKTGATEDKILKILAEEIAPIQDKLKTAKDMHGKDYYRRMLDEEFKDFIEKEGDGYILFVDEINQGSPDTFNTLYSITHPDPKMRRWSSHPIGKCQVVACGNLPDGTDGTVYLNEPPTPLLNRFFVFELKPDNKSTTKYLKEKYKNIPQVAKYIKTMLDEKIAPRDIDQVLNIIAFEEDPLLVTAKLGSALTAKIYEIQKGIKSLDPAEMLKNAREIYNKFKEDGYVIFGPETISSEAELKEKFKEFLSDEEIASVFKGGE